MLVVIPATAQHKPVVALSIKRLQQQLPSARFLVVCPDPARYADMVSDDIAVEPDSAYAPVSKPQLSGLLTPEKRHQAGWYFQQLLKYAIVVKSGARQVLVLDADTVMLRDARYEPGTFFTSRERNDGYFIHYQRLLGLSPRLKASAITNGMWFESEALSMMLGAIERQHGGIAWWRTIISIANGIPSTGAFSEYETYANWYAATFGSHREIPIHMFRRGDLLLSETSDHEAVIQRVEARGYDLVAFELHHHGNWWRRAATGMVLQLGLRVW
jgi:hypothetical protein